MEKYVQLPFDTANRVNDYLSVLTWGEKLVSVQSMKTKNVLMEEEVTDDYTSADLVVHDVETLDIHCGTTFLDTPTVVLKAYTDNGRTVGNIRMFGVTLDTLKDAIAKYESLF